MKQDSIAHIEVAPYHPSSNCLAERAVQMLKKGQKMQQKGTLQTKLSNFLFNYRITPQTIIGTSL